MLSIVPKSEPTPKQAVIEKIKKRGNLRQVWQCNRCGCRELVSVIAGATVLNGRVTGTVIAKHECLNCWKDGIYSPMVAGLKPV